MLKPWAKARAAPFFRLGSTSALYTAAICSSGMSSITTSAPFTASAISFTSRPAFLALSQEAPPRRNPTVTFTPESFRFWAWAWPCEP